MMLYPAMNELLEHQRVSLFRGESRDMVIFILFITVVVN